MDSFVQKTFIPKTIPKQQTSIPSPKKIDLDFQNDGEEEEEEIPLTKKQKIQKKWYIEKKHELIFNCFFVCRKEFPKIIF